MTAMTVALVVGSGVALAAVKFGTEGRDFIRGTNEDDVLYGRGSVDVVLGKGADDALYGDRGNDFLSGGSGTVEGNITFDRRGRVTSIIPDGEDRLFGGEGKDWLFAGSDDDVTFGGKGNDTLGLLFYEFIFDTGNDVFYGGSGNDEVWSFDGDLSRPFRDVVFCGGGRDRVIADPLDKVSGDCEKVRRLRF